MARGYRTGALPFGSLTPNKYKDIEITGFYYEKGHTYISFKIIDNIPSPLNIEINGVAYEFKRKLSSDTKFVSSVPIFNVGSKYKIVILN